MNKTKQKILATLCALGCTFSGNTKKANADDDNVGLAVGIAGVVLPFIGIFITAVLSYRFSTRKQRQMDEERMNDIKGSDFDFNSIDVDVAREQMQEVVEMYPYAKEECEIIIDFICGAIKTKQENPQAQIPVLSLDGIPGCGKTSLLKRLLASIGITPIVISPTDVDNGNKKVSPLQQAYGSWTSRFGNYFMQVDAPLTKALKVNKNYTCVIFDDADKFAPEVIQGFWNIADGGKIKSGDSYIDTNKLFTFVTSNKSIDKLADNMLLDNHICVDKEWADAIKTRFMCLTIPPPRLIDYKDKFGNLLGEFASLYEDTNIFASDDIVDSIAKFYFNNRKCMRNINESRIYLNGALSRFRSKGVNDVELEFSNNSIRLVESSKQLNEILKDNSSVNNESSDSSNTPGNDSAVAAESSSLNNNILDQIKRINIEDNRSLVDPVG